MKKKVLKEIDSRISINSQVIENHIKYPDSISSSKVCERCEARLNELQALRKIISKLK